MSLMEKYLISKPVRYLFVFFEFGKVAFIFAIALLLFYFLIIQIFIVDGLSMFPSFRDREFMLVDRATYFFREPKRGEVIVFVFPGTRSSRFIKRIIGLPYEHIKISQGKVFINDKELNEKEYLKVPTWGETDLVLKKDEYFVLGDNRLVSNDSRIWGTLSREEIIGRAIFIALPLKEKRIVLTPAYNI